VYSGGNVAIFCDAPPPPPNFQPPVFTDVSVGGNVASVTFSKPVCRTAPWTPAFWQVIANGIVQDLDIADNIPICTAAADNGVPNASVFLVTAPSPGSFVAVTLTQAAHFDLRDAAGNPPNTPQTRTATAGAPETVPPTLVSAAGNLGTFIVHFTFSEPVWCTGFVPSDYVVTDNNPATTDPIVVGMSFNDPCGTTQISSHRTFAVQLNAPLPGDTTFTALLLPQPGEIRDISGNSLPNPSSATFNTGTPDFTPPTLTDTRVVNNIASTDFSDVGDAFTVTFSEKMNGSIFGLIPIVDQDGSTATISCGNNASCTWNIAVTTMTVTLTQTLANSGGTTPGLQLPATISALIGLADVAGNAPDLAGSADRVIDVEP